MCKSRFGDGHEIAGSFHHFAVADRVVSPGSRHIPKEAYILIFPKIKLLRRFFFFVVVFPKIHTFDCLIPAEA